MGICLISIMSRHPRSLAILFFAEFTMSFTYWGLQSLLVLYLTHNLKLTSNGAYIVFGTFTALTYMVSIIGGVFADKLLGFKHALITGVILTIIGNLVLSISNIHLVYFGLALMICGSALFTPSCSNLLGVFYSEVDMRRDRGFTIFYVGANMGGVLGPITYGILSIYTDWHSCFILGALLTGAALILFGVFRGWFKNKGISPISNKKLKICFIGLAYCSLFLILSVVCFLIEYIKYTGLLLSITGLLTLLYLTVVSFKKYPEQKEYVFILVILMLFCLFFFTIEFQVNSSLILFIDQYVNREFSYWIIPANIFASLEPIAVIIMSPVMVLLWKHTMKYEPSLAAKSVFGLLLTSVSFLVFAATAYTVFKTGSKATIFPIIIANLLLGAAEVSLMPILISAITKYGPAGMKGTLMGSLYLALAFSGYLAGMIATLTSAPNANIHMPNQFYHVYIHLSIYTSIAALVGYGLFKLFKLVLLGGTQKQFDLL